MATVWLYSLVSYDYYRWEDVVGVCASFEVAMEKAKEHGLPIVDYRDQNLQAILDAMKANEQKHILIQEWSVKF